MDELRKLAETEMYLFHGSAASDIQILEPRQAISFGKPDGKPCIAASEVVEPAIFMAILGSRHTGGWGKSVSQRSQYGFYMAKRDYDRARVEDWRGYVYVLPRKLFDHYSAWNGEPMSR